MEGIFSGTFFNRFRQGNPASRLATTSGQFSNGTEFITIAQSEITHVTVELPHPFRLQITAGLLPFGGGKGGFRALAAHGADHVD